MTLIFYLMSQTISVIIPSVLGNSFDEIHLTIHHHTNFNKTIRSDLMRLTDSRYFDFKVDKRNVKYQSSDDEEKRVEELDARLIHDRCHDEPD